LLGERDRGIIEKLLFVSLGGGWGIKKEFKRIDIFSFLYSFVAIRVRERFRIGALIWKGRELTSSTSDSH
jgi:hypothetical protein